MCISQDLYNRLKRSIFALNKYKGISSAKALEVVKNAIVKALFPDAGENGTVKLIAGHGGTLDQSATGVLVVGLFWGCKLLTHFLKGPKQYEFCLKLGQATTTFNEEGEITDESDFSHVTKENLFAACSRFVGEIEQIAPIYSSLKFQGKRLSDLARAGVDVEPKTRTVRCHSLTIKDVEFPYVTAQVTCGGGFYVRSLAHDLGKELGTHAHVVSLMRLVQSPFHLDDCISMDQLSLKTILEATSRTNQLYKTELKSAMKFTKLKIT